MELVIYLSSLLLIGTCSVVRSEILVALAQPSIIDIRIAPTTNVSAFTRLRITKFVSGIDFDPVEGRLYWATKTNLYSTDKQGKAREEYKISVTRVVIDSKHALLFYASSSDKLIGVLSLYEFHQKTLVNGSMTPRAITLDVENRQIYWLNTDTGVIERCDYDGSSRETVLTRPGALGLALDEKEQRLYFGSKHELMSSDLEGQNVMSVWSGEEGQSIWTLKIYRNNLYIVYPENKQNVTIYKYGLSDKKVSVFLKQVNKNVADISFLDTELEPVDERLVISDYNICTTNFGDCKYFCLPLPGNNKTCITPDGELDPIDIEIVIVTPEPTVTAPPEIPVPTDDPKFGKVVGDDCCVTKPSLQLLIILVASLYFLYN